METTVEDTDTIMDAIKGAVITVIIHMEVIATTTVDTPIIVNMDIDIGIIPEVRVSPFITVIKDYIMVLHPSDKRV